MTLTEFLLARIDDDEDAARSRPAEDFYWDPLGLEMLDIGPGDEWRL